MHVISATNSLLFIMVGEGGGVRAELRILKPRQNNMVYCTWGFCNIPGGGGID